MQSWLGVSICRIQQGVLICSNKKNGCPPIEGSLITIIKTLISLETESLRGGGKFSHGGLE